MKLLIYILLFGTVICSRTVVAAPVPSPTRLFIRDGSNAAIVRLTNDSDVDVIYKIYVRSWQQLPFGDDIFNKTGDIGVDKDTLRLGPHEAGNVKININNYPKIHEPEAAYRLFFEEPSVNGNQAGVFIKRITSMPIFIGSADEKSAVTTSSIGLAKGRVKVSLRNIGYRAARPTSIVIRGLADNDAEVFRITKPGWYILANRQKEYEIAIANIDCLRMRKLYVEVRLDAELVRSALMWPHENCDVNIKESGFKGDELKVLPPS
jgi:P pilus assembly chaperone PapD